MIYAYAVRVQLFNRKWFGGQSIRPIHKFMLTKLLIRI